MFCNKCGTQLDDDAKFCPNCGTDTTDTTANAPTPEYTTYADVPPTPQVSATPILVFGILSLYLGTIFGIIFGKIAQNKAAEYQAITGCELSGIAKVGRILGKVGFIVGIVTTCLIPLYIIYFIALFSLM